jgi:hypothetical protein
MQYEDDAEIAPSTIPPLQGVAATYKSTLDSLMSFVHFTARPYSRDRTYTKGKLHALTPENVLHWMNLKAFGVADPPMDANPTLVKGNLLVFWKKAISFFMPNCFMVWDSGCNDEGNPTRSIEVNNLIKRVKKKEVHKQGAALQCRHAITEDEFQTMQKILQNHDKTSMIWQFGLYALTNFQFNLLAHIDATT